MEGRRDGHALREVLFRKVVGAHRPEDRFGVGAGELPERRREPGQRAVVLGVVQQMLGAPGSGGHHDVRGGDRGGALTPSGPGSGALERHLPRAVGTLVHATDGRAVENPGPGPLGQAEVVLEQGVLGPVPAAGHALAALDTGGPIRPHTPEVRVADGLAGLALSPGLLPEEHPDRRVDEGVLGAHVPCDGLHDVVGMGMGGVGDHTEHPAPLIVERGELVLPVGDVAPLPVPEERGVGLVEGVGVIE